MTPPPFEVSEPFRLNLRRQRRRAGLSQEQLAFRASLHRSEVSLLERGVRVPRLDTFVKLAASIEIAAGELLDGIEWVPASERSEGTFWTPDPGRLERRAAQERAAAVRARRTRSVDADGAAREAREESERRGERSDG